MSKEKPIEENELLDVAIDLLSMRLPPKWEVKKQGNGDSEEIDVTLQSPNSGHAAFFLVEVKRNFAVRDVQQLLGGPWRRLSKRINQPLLLVAEYLGPRVRDLLVAENISYVDMTGNIRINVDSPAIFIEMQGATKNPASTKTRSSANGPKARGVVRFLVDFAPPYSGVEIASAANVNEGYASRILDAFRDEGFIERSSSGLVNNVDWVGLLRRGKGTSGLLDSSKASFYVARQGPTGLLNLIRDTGQRNSQIVVTGSFAASQLAPVAAPTLLVMYTMKPIELANEYQLLPTSAGADVALIRPDNDAVMTRTRSDGGIDWAATSQVAMDCLAGNGRMPAEGEALIQWMRSNESFWRISSIDGLRSNENWKSR